MTPKPAPNPPGAAPWTTQEIDDSNVFGIYDAGGNLVADVYPIELEPSAEQRARSLVLAVNSFGSLVEALEGLTTQVDALLTVTYFTPMVRATLEKALSQARTALITAYPAAVVEPTKREEPRC